MSSTAGSYTEPMTSEGFGVQRASSFVRIWRCGLLIVLISYLVFGLPALHAQSFYGRIRGVVKDPNGATMANVKVSITDQAQGTVRSTNTSSDGEYVFGDVIPATYSIAAEMNGFQRFEQKNVTVSTQQDVTLDLNLQLGQVSQTVEVTSQVPAIESSNASQGQVLSNQNLTDLPNIGRNPFIMSKLAANVVTLGNPVYNRMEDQSGSADIAMGGGPAQTNNYLIDGVPISDAANRAIIIPSIEAVQEVKIQTNTYDAEIGRTGGGMFNTYLKSGGNGYHGSAYGSTRQTNWDANGFFNNAAGLPLPPQTNYTWAGSLGGPVSIPKLYDGKNRTFFFLALEGYNDTQAVSSSGFTPTLLERAGNFSQTNAPNGGLQQIYNPLSTVQNADGTYSRALFPNNVIPTPMLNPVGLAIAKTLALPQTPAAFYGDPNATAASSITSHARQYVGKLDEDFTHWWRASLSYMHYYSKSPGANFFGGVSAPEQWTLLRDVDATAINNLFTVSPTTVVTVRYGFNRFPNQTTLTTQNMDLTTLGFPQSLAAQQQYPTFPVIFTNNLYPQDGQGNLGTNQKYVYNFVSYNVSAGISKSINRHTLKAGFDYRRIKVNGNNFSDSSGNYTFNGVFTQSNPTNVVSGTGADLADMLLGYPAAGDSLLSIKLNDFTNYYGLYFQDDYRITNKLTINLGLRWEREDGIQEENNGLVTNFDTQAVNPLAAAVPANLFAFGAPKGIVQFAGLNGNPTSVGNPNLSKFSPRVGFAWQVAPKTVIRGGYGIFWAPQFSIGSPLATPGYSVTTSYIASTNGNATPAGTLSNPFPNGLTQPAGNTQGPATGNGQAISIFDPNARSPRVQQYSFDIQQELPAGIVLEVGFVGSHGTHLPLNINMNTLPTSFFSEGAALNQQVANPFYGNGGTGVIGTPNLQQYQLNLPYPTFSAVNYTNSDLGKSVYDSMVAIGRKRFSQGLTFISSFTWSILKDNAVGQNPFNLAADYSLSTNDVPLRWSNGFTYELPFGKGKHWLSNGTALNYVVGGWSINGTGIIQSGFPLAITQSNNLNGAFGYTSQRPNATGISPATSGSQGYRLDNYINPAAFSEAPQFTFGNVGRLIPLYGPGFATWDMSLFKKIPIYEQVNAEFRFEMLNAFNTPQFANPNTTFGSNSFGKITSQANLGREIQMGLRFVF
jgi:trimeric autotransporter adhesin